MPKPSDWLYYPPNLADLEHRDNPVVVLPKLPQRGYKFEKQQKRAHSAAAIKNGPIEQALKSPAEVEFIRRVHAECTWMDDSVSSIKVRIRVRGIGDIGFDRGGTETLVHVRVDPRDPEIHGVGIRVEGKRESAPLFRFTAETTSNLKTGFQMSHIELGLDEDWDMLRRAVFGDSVKISNMGMMRALVPLIAVAHTYLQLDTTVVPITDALFGYRDWTKWLAAEKRCPSNVLIDPLLVIVDSYLFEPIPLGFVPSSLPI